jgi:hypothetical protein
MARHHQADPPAYGCSRPARGPGLATPLTLRAGRRRLPEAKGRSGRIFHRPGWPKLSNHAIFGSPRVDRLSGDSFGWKVGFQERGFSFQGQFDPNGGALLR